MLGKAKLIEIIPNSTDHELKIVNLNNDISSGKHIFLFLHIPQAPWTPNSVDTPAFFETIKGYPNLRAVFHGHEHDQDGFRTESAIPFIFDAHVGGNLGTPYRGFRVVEILKNNSFVSYMMNPSEKMKEEKWKIYS
jgi:hypothetical protein